MRILKRSTIIDILALAGWIFWELSKLAMLLAFGFVFIISAAALLS